MAYRIHCTPDVSDYLRDPLGLSREGRLRLFTFLHLDLAEFGDTFRNDASRRLIPGGEHFEVDFLFLDREGDGEWHRFRFVVSDAAAVYGILTIVYADETT